MTDTPQAEAKDVPLHSNPHNAAESLRGDFPVVGIGASAGGLDACRKFLAAFPGDNGMAFILIQHLDPTHESMMVDLLAAYTPMTVCQATDGMPIQPDHVYAIPPGTYLSVAGGALHLSQPRERHGSRLPFDFLLHSLAEECGPRAIGVVLSGTGTDGSLGVKSVKEKCGMVIAQTPAEAAYDGMPRNAIATGAVDLVLPVAEIPDAIVKYASTSSDDGAAPQGATRDWLPEVIGLLRAKTTCDFTLYKHGTLERRIARRMAMASIGSDDIDRYLDMLRNDTGELDRLAEDMLINVTSFFRDPEVFDHLAEKIIPGLVRDRESDQPLRIWVAGCSTGEESYSLAILFQEEILAAGSNVKLQILASDVDQDAVASAREGLYPETIEANVSPARLAKFFTKEGRGFRVTPELRAAVVFTVQDVLADPPFSNLALISCRNLLIYLRPEAQAKVISVFHFALRIDGILLLGTSESIADADGRFKVIAKSERLYRHARPSRLGEISFSKGAIDGVRAPARPDKGPARSRQAVLADLCQRLVIEAFAPAAILINRKNECLYSLGPVSRYLHFSPGHPTHDLLAIASPGMRTKLRSAIQQACHENVPIVVAGCRMTHEGETIQFGINVRPVESEGEDLLLICIVDEPKPEQRQANPITSGDDPSAALLEQELEATRTELQVAIRNLDLSLEDQRIINEETLSVQEEFQSTNEELLTSKEELQSLNEELTALNGQLQETLERQRTTSNDLQNVLYSTNVATLFLDTHLNIRLFTPATTSLFSVIPGDIGRPLANLSSLAVDDALLNDAQTVLQTQEPAEREIEAKSGAWYLRRILPYRTRDGGAEGVVITFTDISDRKQVLDELWVTKQQAEAATIAKSRFLAAASHDLRQPLQTLALLQGLLANSVEGEKAQKLVLRIDETLGTMSTMLNTLLDINQIDSGAVHPEMSDIPVADLLARLEDDFLYHAQSLGLTLRVVRCNRVIRSDPHLLEQMIRNLLSNALKYTKSGKILLGCRRREGALSIEVWDSGIGIPADALEAIFDEYYQLDNAARERSRGLGLGLPIVRRLGNLLGYPIRVRSVPGKGSVFAIDVTLPQSEVPPAIRPHRHGIDDQTIAPAPRTGAILVVEDDPEVRALLELILTDDGHRVATAHDGPAARELVKRGTFQPDLLLADLNLPNGMNGLDVATMLRQILRREIPVIILTGDISSATSRNSAFLNCVQITKPVGLKELTNAVQRLLPAPQPALPSRTQLPADATGVAEPPVIFVVDDDAQIRDAIRSVLEESGRTVEDYPDCETFLAAYRPRRESCLLIDAYLPGMNGLELLQRLHDEGHCLPSIMITGNSDVQMAIQAMKAGASDFLEKPVGNSELLASVERALERAKDSSKVVAWREDAANHLAGLTLRQRQIMEMVLAGHPSKNIAADLGISQRTVENHRSSIMKKTGSKSLPALARLAIAAV